ncbi:hypothetical protein KL909_003638 [Ogataea angusta]|nr:hypothetical protein KL909_003638 [Ogataea angusta]
MEAFRLPRRPRPAPPATSDGGPTRDNHDDGALFVCKGVKYYSPALFYAAPAITKAPFPMLICDVLKLRDCRLVYKNGGYTPASQNILMFGNHPVQKIMVQGKVVGERWHEMSQDKFFMFLEISDGTAESALTVRIQSQLYHQRLIGFEKNNNLLVQVRGVANVYNDQVEIHADWLDVVGDKRDMGVEMDWWDRALGMKAEVLQDPWDLRGQVDEAKKKLESLSEECEEERRAAKEQQKREEAFELQRVSESERAKEEHTTAADTAVDGQVAESAEQDSDGSGYATATEIEDDESSEVYEGMREEEAEQEEVIEEEAAVIGQEMAVLEEETRSSGEEMEQAKVDSRAVAEAEQPVVKRRKKSEKVPDKTPEAPEEAKAPKTVDVQKTEEQTSAGIQFLLPPPAFVGTRVSVSLLSRFEDDHDAVEKEILRYCLQTDSSKFSLDRLMSDRSVTLAVYEAILRTRAEQSSEPLDSELDQHSFKLIFHSARKSLCHTKLVKLTKSSNIETAGLKNVQEYLSNLVDHVMHQTKIAVQELKDGSDNVGEFCQNMVQFYHTRLGRLVLTSRSMISKVQDKFSATITAPVIRQIMAHTIGSAETDHSIELGDGLQVNFTWYYLVKHCHYMYLPEIVHSGK